MTTAVRTLVAWCPDWPVVAAGVGDGEVVPIVVVHANRVVACSAAARVEGIRRGLRRREAQGRCPDVVVVEAEPDRDARAFEPVAAALEAAFAPRVEVIRPGMCAFATRGPSRYFGGDDVLAARVVALVEEVMEQRGCRAGVADGPFAAGLAARRSDIVPRGETPAYLAPFPVSTLERPDLVDLLERLGLRTLGDFADLPPAAVLARFGPAGSVAHRLARGLDERPLATRTPPPDLVVTLELDPPVERVDAAAFAARTLAARLHDELSSRALMCTRVAIEAETEHGARFERVWRHDGALTPGAMAERVRWQLDGWLNGTSRAPRPTAGIALLRLVPEEVHPDDGRQLGFWGGETAADERGLRAVARVQGLLGPDAVVGAVVGGGRGPAEQVQLVAWGDAREPARPAGPPWPGRVPPPSPATVHADPIPAEVVDASGSLLGVTGRALLTAAPARLRVDGGPWADIKGWAGPWPVDERWWDPRAHRRHARFQVLAGDTAHLVAVEGGRWWVEATYD